MIFEQGFKGIQAFIFDINGGKEEEEERENYREKGTEFKISEITE